MEIANLTLADLTRPDVLSDPYPTYAALRQQDPMHLDPETNSWMVTRHADAAAILADRRFSAQRPYEGGDIAKESPMEQALSLQMLFMDPPSHTRLRSLFSKAFNPNRVERLRPEIIGVVGDLFDKAVSLSEGGAVDFAQAIAGPLPVIVIAQLIGIPAEDWERTCVWSYSLGRFLLAKPSGEAEAGTMQRDVLALIGYFQQLIDARKAKPADDMLSDLLSVEDLGDRLSTQELIVNLMLLFAAGHLTTSHLLGNSLLAFSRFPEQWELVVNDPTLMSGATSELLRFDAPVQAVNRYASEGVQMGQRIIRAGTQVTVFLGSANRDETHFPEPDTLQIQRAGTRILSFGHGIHACLGAALARLETEVLFRELIQHFPKTIVCERRPARFPSHIIRGIASLPILLR